MPRALVFMRRLLVGLGAESFPAVPLASQVYVLSRFGSRFVLVFWGRSIKENEC